MERAQPIRLLLVTGDSAVAGWLLRVLEEAPETQATQTPAMELVGAIAAGDEALAFALAARPDVILFHLEAGGIAAIERLAAQCPVPILVLAAECDALTRARAVRSGARGVVLRHEAPVMIRKAVRKVQEGEFWVDRITIARILQELTAGASQPSEPTAIGRIANLTTRESDIVRALLGEEGASSRELAARLRISEQTLRNHFSSIYRKLGIPNRVGLVAYATRHRLDAAG
jgi:DNA-binding NarL/FixJ family response regulator